MTLANYWCVNCHTHTLHWLQDQTCKDCGNLNLLVPKPPAPEDPIVAQLKRIADSLELLARRHGANPPSPY